MIVVTISGSGQDLGLWSAGAQVATLGHSPDSPINLGAADQRDRTGEEPLHSWPRTFKAAPGRQQLLALRYNILKHFHQIL